MSSIEHLREQTVEIRRDILKMLHAAGSGHPGGSLSMVEILTTLFFDVMDYKPDRPDWDQRDRFVLSKGHGVPALYATLAHRGVFSTDDLMTLRKLGSPLQGHPDVSRLPAVEASTGSLGQGLSIAAGMAMGNRQHGYDNHVFCLISDGENNEGQIWEAALFAPNHELSNLTVIIDYNKYQLDGATEDVLSLEPMIEKWDSFGWNVKRIDGHELPEVHQTLSEAKHDSGPPHCIIADTIKGKGVSFMEGDNEFHGRAPTDEELDRALEELDEREAVMT